MSDTFGAGSRARAAASRRDVLRGAGLLAAGAATFGGWLPGPASAQETFVWYTGLALEASDELSKMFTAKTGIPAEYFRAGSNNLAQKFEQEVQADQVRCSALLITTPTLVARWAEQGLILPYDSPEFAQYPEQFVLQGFAGPASAEPLCMAYNSEMIAAEEAPQSWEDLLDPKWKGKLALTDAASAASALHWYAALRSVHGPSFMEKLSEQDVLVRTGGADVANTLVSGERPVAAMITQSHASRAIGAGASLRIVVPEEGVPLVYSVICVPAKAPSPEIGKQFVDFVLGEEAQVMLQNKYFSPSLRKGIPPIELDTGARALGDITPIASSPQDMEKFLGEQETLIQEYMDLFK
ncbi:MAG TPA: extracellular solute-binding protein [Geminicoccaceae bacterium]|nr:extracellular solute-binding protein [Geminicoccaceae bacterium]